MRDTVTGERVSVVHGFIPGQVVNPKNQRWHWRHRHAWSKGWRDRTRLILGPQARMARWPATVPKRVTLTAHVGRLFDSHDNLRVALSPVVDEMKQNVWTMHGYRRGLGLIVDDADRYGHVFEYHQEVAKTKTARGVTVTVEPRERGDT